MALAWSRQAEQFSRIVTYTRGRLRYRQAVNIYPSAGKRLDNHNGTQALCSLGP